MAAANKRRRGTTTTATAAAATQRRRRRRTAAAAAAAAAALALFGSFVLLLSIPLFFSPSSPSPSNFFSFFSLLGDHDDAGRITAAGAGASAFPSYLYRRRCPCVDDSDDENENGTSSPPAFRACRCCSPRRLHLAQRTDVVVAVGDGDDSEGEYGAVVSVTLSFTLEDGCCSGGDSNDGGRTGGTCYPIVLYGRVGERQAEKDDEEEEEVGRIVLDEDENGNNRNDNDDGVGSYRFEKLRFNYTSEKTTTTSSSSSSSSSTGTGTSATYQSDWIYHVELPDLRAGLVEYWYRVVVVVDDVDDSADSATAEKGGIAKDEGGPVLETSTATSRRRRRLLVERNQPRHQRREVVVGETGPYSFLTPPLSAGVARTSPERAATSIALVGDLGQTSDSTKTMYNVWRSSAAAEAVPTTATKRNASDVPVVSHLLIAGDMSYADSDPERWESWFDAMEPLLRHVPTHVAAGNHEIECDTSNGNLFVPYESYFRNPNRIKEAEIEPYRPPFWKRRPWSTCSAPSQFEASYDYGNAFYSYRHGLAKIVVLSSYSNTAIGSVQYEWLLHELSDRYNRTETPWLIVAFHSPLYTTFLGHVDEIEAKKMKSSMEPLFHQYGVNLVVSGHDHGYMRTRSLDENGRVDPTGRSPIYLTVGAGGNRERHSRGYRSPSKSEEWVVRRTLVDYGFGHLTLRNATHAHFRWVRDRVETDGGIEDRVWFRNPHA